MASRCNGGEARGPGACGWVILLDMTLALSALASSVAGGIFLSAGLSLHEKQVDEGARDALTLFAVWWVGLAIYAVAGASADLTAALGVESLAFFLVVRYAQMIAFCIGLWGLVYYIAYLLTGRRAWRAPLALVYALYYAGILFALTLGRPVGVAVREWGVDLAYAAPAVDAWVLALLIVLPPLMASATYLALLLAVRSATQRLRIVLVVVGTVAWLLAMLAGAGPSQAWWSALPPVLALLAAWSVSWAYHPPAWVRRRIVMADAPAPVDARM